MRVSIVVLGDFGRSPRMQYHALALAQNHVDVDVIGYQGTAPLRAVSEHSRIRLHLIAPALAELAGQPKLGFIAYALVRIAVQGVLVFWKMLMVERPDVVLVQNPPALPTLIICLVAARIRSSRLVIDWHNFSHSMLALKLGTESLAVRMLRSFELTIGRRADGHLCVSQAMKTELAERWALTGAVVFRDRPAGMFFPQPPEKRTETIRRCVGALPSIADPARPAVVVCPTSWTADEDLSTLIDAAAHYDRQVLANRPAAGSALPPLLILITGRGPLRDRYEARISRMTLHRVSIRTLWLAYEDYVLLVGSADLGVSCHRSASGVDLAMKVADMFGAALPVCALDYGAGLTEQVRHGETGLIFKDGAQLAAQFCELLRGFPEETPLRRHLRGNLARLENDRWDDCWRREAAPVLLS